METKIKRLYTFNQGGHIIYCWVIPHVSGGRKKKGVKNTRESFHKEYKEILEHIKQTTQD